jgi:hypothetical protein
VFVNVGPGKLSLMKEDIDGSFEPATHHNIGESLDFFCIFQIKLFCEVCKKPLEELDEELV